MSKRRLDIRNIRKKIDEKGYHGLFKYEETYYRKRLVDACDRLCSEIVRNRDCPGVCVSYGIKVCKGKNLTFKTSQCCHGIRRGYYSHRWDLRNLYAGCASCNVYGKQDHNNAITARIIKDYGMEVWDEMWSTKNMKKPKIRELEELYEELKKKLKNFIVK